MLKLVYSSILVKNTHDTSIFNGESWFSGIFNNQKWPQNTKGEKS